MIRFAVEYRGAKGWSVNHFKVGGNMAWKLTREARQVKQEIIFYAKNQLQHSNWEPTPPLIVRLSGRFKDKRSTPDLHNCAKLVCDALQEALGVNDQAFAVICAEPGLVQDREEAAMVTIEVQQGALMDQDEAREWVVRVAHLE